MRGVTGNRKRNPENFTLFQLTRLMRGVTNRIHRGGCSQQISTHTPHARRDVRKSLSISVMLHFNSHASCEA